MGFNFQVRFLDTDFQNVTGISSEHSALLAELHKPSISWFIDVWNGINSPIIGTAPRGMSLCLMSGLSWVPWPPLAVSLALDQVKLWAGRLQEIHVSVTSQGDFLRSVGVRGGHILIQCCPAPLAGVGWCLQLLACLPAEKLLLWPRSQKNENCISHPASTPSYQCTCQHAQLCLRLWPLTSLPRTFLAGKPVASLQPGKRTSRLAGYSSPLPLPLSQFKCPLRSFQGVFEVKILFIMILGYDIFSLILSWLYSEIFHLLYDMWRYHCSDVNM